MAQTNEKLETFDEDLYTPDGRRKIYMKKKVIILGDGGVGKTTLLYRYINHVFIDSTKMTVGSEFLVKKLKIDEPDKMYNISLLLWDFAGQERFRFILKNYLKGAEAIILAFDLTRFKTFQGLENWVELLKEGGAWKNPKMKYFLVGTKKDLLSNGFYFIMPEDIEAFMKEAGIKYYQETSSLTGEGVEEFFIKVAKTLIRE